MPRKKTQSASRESCAPWRQPLCPAPSNEEGRGVVTEQGTRRPGYCFCVPQVTKLDRGPRSTGAADRSIDQIEVALQVAARSMTQARLHERLLQSAGVRLDRAGAALLYKLYVHRDSLRVTSLADLLGVDAPTVTRKVQQLEHEGYVVRHPDPDDRRASRIALSPAGRRTLERVLDARRAWIGSLFDGWSKAELASFASMLGRFSTTLEGATAENE
jgi:DNA-binding MarR family transcriptional regulator